MATNPRLPHDGRYEERKQPQLVQNTDAFSQSVREADYQAC